MLSSQIEFLPPPTPNRPKRAYTKPEKRKPDIVPHHFRITPAVKQILIDIHLIGEGMLLKDQLEALHFASLEAGKERQSDSSARDCIKYLFHHKQKYIDRIPIEPISKGRPRFLNVLDEGGVKLVTRLLRIPKSTLTKKRSQIKKNKQLTLAHSIEVIDLRIIFERLAQLGYFTIADVIGERAFKSEALKDQVPFIYTERVKNGEVVDVVERKEPDLWFGLRYPAELYRNKSITPVGFFVECDRGSESLPVIAKKVAAYELFREIGLAKDIYGTRSFRVLFIVKTEKNVRSERRIDKFIKTIIQAAGDNAYFYWLTEYDNIDMFRPLSLLKDIWQVPYIEGLQSIRTP